MQPVKDNPRVTIVSVCPFIIYETKPGLVPSVFHIPPVKTGEVGILPLSDGHYFERIAASSRVIAIPIRAEELAESIVNDCCKSQMGYGDETKPGLFWLSGNLTVADIRKNHAAALTQAHEYQNKWFHMMVEEADDLWSKYHQHRMIPETSRIGARVIGVEREWVMPELNNLPSTMINCPGCGNRVSTLSALCGNCKVIINEEKFKTLKFAGTPVKA